MTGIALLAAAVAATLAPAKAGVLESVRGFFDAELHLVSEVRTNAADRTVTVSRYERQSHPVYVLRAETAGTVDASGLLPEPVAPRPDLVAAVDLSDGAISRPGRPVRGPAEAGDRAGGVLRHRRRAAPAFLPEAERDAAVRLLVRERLPEVREGLVREVLGRLPPPAPQLGLQHDRQLVRPPDLPAGPHALRRARGGRLARHFRQLGPVVQVPRSLRPVVQAGLPEGARGARARGARSVVHRLLHRQRDPVGLHGHGPGAVDAVERRRPAGEGRVPPAARGEGPRRPCGSQAERCAALRNFVSSALSNPLVVGVHWHQYSDQATSGRFDGECFQVGWTDICDRPYAETVETLRSIDIYRERMTGKK